jgi:D-alanyl-D-alanine dipeptidase
MYNSASSNNVVLLIDPQVLAIPIKECNEEMMDLIQQDIILYGDSPEIPNNHDYTKIRRTLYEKLIEAQSYLPKHLKFCVYECYRSLQLQAQLFNQRYKIVQEANPGLEHAQIFKETALLVSPTINLDGSKNIPPHGAGAAIDLYLIDEENQYVDMGIHPKDWMQDTEGTLSRTDSLKISGIAKEHRIMMSNALNKVDFANYPGEYWHWSYGDRYWAYQKGKAFALYNLI